MYTDGIHYLEQNGAAWLVDMVASHLSCHKGLADKCGGLIFTTFTRKGDGGSLEARADIEKPILFEQDVEYTDFPLDSIQIWAQHDGKCWVMFLASEY
jgi:hypothetical protein